ncbi:MAG TPA: hypothetical protein VM577_08045, partial [Anaerovoracaceae bacterium]|nr:hypothetical protein [Anaerovoracaceae bacterium]
KSMQNENVAVHPVIFYNIMDLVGITQWQVILNKDEFTFLIAGKREPGIENKIIELLNEALSKINVKPPRISIRYSDLQRNSRGKLSLIINNL